MKWNNYGLWVALGALVAMIVTDLTDVTPEKVQGYINIGLAVITAAGIVSNPKVNGSSIKTATALTIVTKGMVSNECST